MKKIRSSLVVILMVVLFVCSTFAVQAKTVTGTFSDGTYGITLSKRSSTNIAASISVTIEEPSAPSVWVYQTGTVIGSQETRSLDASGFNGCYREQTAEQYYFCILYVYGGFREGRNIVRVKYLRQVIAFVVTCLESKKG